MAITEELRQVVEGRRYLTVSEARALMQRILAGEASDVELAALLGALAARREAGTEIAGFALALREAATMLPLTEAERDEVVDTCGTGGDASGTFNISTGAALVAAAAGARVAKHGNRAVTSKCGSADVLQALGIPVDLPPEAAAEALRKHGFCFLLAPAHHPALRVVMPVRKALGVRTVLHVLGPLLSPAGTRRQVIGVYAPRLVVPVAQAMLELGTRHALVVHGGGGLDEFSLEEPNQSVEVREDKVLPTKVSAEALGLQPAPLSALQGGDAVANAHLLNEIFAGASGPRRDIVVLNAAAVLVVAGIAADIPEGIRRAAEAIDTSAVTELVTQLRA